MRYEEARPAAPIVDDVRCYWFLAEESASDAGPHTATGDASDADPALPDGSPELILNLADPFIAVAADGAERVQPLAFLVGQITGPYLVRPSGRVDLVGIRLEACGATWLAADLRLLTDTFVDVAEAHRGALERLRAELREHATPAARAAALDRVLPALIAAGRRADWRVREAVREMRASHGPVHIGALAARLRTTPRTLQRHFATDVGITPKLLTRIVRFQRVFSAWREDPASLARVASDCGYYDHAHLVRDFRELAGVAPARFLLDQPEFTRFFTN
jgi:AraC-like DNA-binding protein